MYAAIDDYPKQFMAGFRLAEVLSVIANDQSIEQVIILASDAAALAAELALSFCQDQLLIPRKVFWGFDLPSNLSSRSLIIVIDLSGKSPEALFLIEQAASASCRPIIVTGAGPVEILAREKNLPWILIPELPSTPKRLMTGYIIALVVQILINARLVSPSLRQDILRSALTTGQMYIVHQAKRIAMSLKGQLLAIYTPDNYALVAHLAKLKINTTCKLPCFWNVFSEALTSELAGFANAGAIRYCALIWQDNEINKQIMRQTQELVAVLDKMRVKSLIIPILGNNYLVKTLSSLLMADWIAYWLALELNIDPTALPIAENVNQSFTPIGQ